MRERRRTYELLYIVSPLRSGNEEETSTVTGRIQQVIESLQGEVLRVDTTAPWGRRKFAYPIRAYNEGEASRRSYTEGFYVLTHLTLPANQVPALDRSLRLNDTVLRYLLTMIDADGAAVASSATFSEESNISDSQDEEDEEAELEEEDA